MIEVPSWEDHAQLAGAVSELAAQVAHLTDRVNAIEEHEHGQPAPTPEPGERPLIELVGRRAATRPEFPVPDHAQTIFEDRSGRTWVRSGDRHIGPATLTNTGTIFHVENSHDVVIQNLTLNATNLYQHTGAVEVRGDADTIGIHRLDVTVDSWAGINVRGSDNRVTRCFASSPKTPLAGGGEYHHIADNVFEQTARGGGGHWGVKPALQHSLVEWNELRGAVLWFDVAHGENEVRYQRIVNSYGPGIHMEIRRFRAPDLGPNVIHHNEVINPGYESTWSEEYQNAGLLSHLSADVWTRNYVNFDPHRSSGIFVWDSDNRKTDTVNSRGAVFEENVIEAVDVDNPPPGNMVRLSGIDPSEVTFTGNLYLIPERHKDHRWFGINGPFLTADEWLAIFPEDRVEYV